PQNWVALFTFLATAIIGSRLSSYAKEQAKKMWESKRQTEQLYSLSRMILLLDDHASAAGQIARHIVHLFGVDSATIFNRYSSTFHRGSEAESPPPRIERLKEIAASGAMVRDEKQKLMIAPIRLGAEPIGSLAIEGPLLSDGAQQALLNLIAIALERERQREETTRAQAEKQSDRLKSALLDAIAHEFKTPLTSIKVAATSLLSPAVLPMAASNEPAPARELATAIDEETDRLTGLVSDAIQMARIEAGTLVPKKAECKLDELLGRVVRDLESRRDGRSLDVRLADDLPPLPADRELLGLTLRLLLDNALKYSPPLSSVTVSANCRNGNVVIGVHDEGAAIPETAQTRLFEKFYRGASTASQVPGTGMGLAIAKEIARLHGGDLWVESKSGEGTTFLLAVPLGSAV
ncbi:MAG: ATP-binding protein, partial [Terriglobia bacterium]